MDSQDSSAPLHHPQPPFSSHHGILMAHQHNPIQEHLPNNSYLLPNNNSILPTTSNSTPRFPFNSAQKPPESHQFSDGSPSGSGGGWFSAEPARKKRGRPRKYSPDNNIGLGLSPQISAAPSLETPVKRHRGRPPGSVKKQLNALGIAGVAFTPHVIIVTPGEDIASKITAFSQQGPRTVFIMAATGAICSVALRQPANSGSIVTYEGRFEIISLSGSFPMVDSNGNQTGALRVSLAGSDGSVIGGEVAGMFKAAAPIQVVIGSFVEDRKKPKSGSSSTPLSNMLNFGTPPGTWANPPSDGGSSDSGDENNGSPIAPASGPVYGSAGHAVQNVAPPPPPLYSNMGWSNSIKM